MFRLFWSTKELKFKNAACPGTNRAALGLLCVLRVFVFWTAIHGVSVCGSVRIDLCLLLERAVCRGNLAHEVVINPVRVQVRDRDYQSEIRLLSANLAFIPARFTLIILSIGHSVPPPECD